MQAGCLFRGRAGWTTAVSRKAPGRATSAMTNLLFVVRCFQREILFEPPSPLVLRCSSGLQLASALRSSGLDFLRMPNQAGQF